VKDSAVSYLNLSAATRWGLNAVLLLGLVIALYLGKTILIPMVIALLLAALLWPAAGALHSGVPLPWLRPRAGFPWLRPSLVKWRVPWAVACTLLVALLVGLALLVPAGTGMGIAKILKEAPRDQPGQQVLYEQFRQRIAEISPATAEQYMPDKAQDFRLFQAIKNLLDPEKQYFIDTLMGIAGYGGNWLLEGILVTFLLLFLLLEGPMLSRRVVEIFGPGPEVQKKVVETLGAMATQVRIYLVWRTIVNFGLALILGVVYSNMGLAYGWQWALLTGCLCYIPYLGQIVAGIPPVLDAFISCGPWWALAILAFYAVMVTVEGYVVVPVVMGRPMQLNATTVLLACLFWHLVWGMPGLFLAMPLMAAVKAICMHVPGWEAWANLMSTQEPAPPSSLPLAPAAPFDYPSGSDVPTPPEPSARYATVKSTVERKVLTDE
jgi:predicted PurR-regulated permease PerM